MEVIFDAPKDRQNLRKHGISLDRANDFDFSSAFFAVDQARDYGEVRYNAIGWIDASLHALTFTQAGELIRAISLRKATRQERQTYAAEN